MDKYLYLDGSNANQNVDIGNYSLYAEKGLFDATSGVALSVTGGSGGADIAKFERTGFGYVAIRVIFILNGEKKVEEIKQD